MQHPRTIFANFLRYPYIASTVDDRVDQIA